MTKIDLYLSILIIFVVGFVLVSWTQYSHASGRKHTTNITNNNYSISDSTCAIAGAAGLHQYKQSAKIEGSIVLANCDSVNALSLGVGRQDGNHLWSVVISVDDGQEQKFDDDQLIEIDPDRAFIGTQWNWTFN